MKELVSHIELLLHEHNCVIIPGFGGFVVNTSPARRDGIATFHPPSCELVFNRDLTYNDGLLAQAYMKNEGILFEAAMVKVELAVEELIRTLRDTHRVDLGSLGYFATNDEKRFVYKPAHFVQPAYFGLGTASLKPLIQMQPATTPSRRAQRPIPHRSVGITAAAAAILLLMMFLLPVGDRTIVRQSAQIISESDLFGNRSQPINSDEATSETPVAEVPAALSMTAIQPETVVEAPATAPEPRVAEVNQPRYYIVVGVYEVKEVAEKMMENLLDRGFSERGWMKRPGRIDVYAVSFTQKEEAENALRKLHNEYPAHRDAWILKR